MKQEDKNSEKPTMIERKTWTEFRSSGLLLFLNSFLHIFGWCLIVEVEDGEVLNCYPARTKFRGFDVKSQSEAYINISKYMQENSSQLLKEAEDE